MPTGYTTEIKNGITFEQYALRCARAFGALINMRDDPSDAPIPQRFEPNDYHATALARSRERLRELLAMTDEAVERAAAKEFDNATTAREVRLAEKAELRRKYETMLGAAQAYVAPSPDHVEFREFMIDQLKESIGWDCGTSRDEPIERLTGAAWRAQQVAACERGIEYYTVGQAEEIERTEKRNRWVAELRRSLERIA